MKTKYILMLSLILTILSCSEKENSTNASGEIDLESAIENAENRRKTDPDASGENKCLLDFQSKYDQLLTENEVLQATGFSKEVLKTKNNNLLKNPEYHEFAYKFNNKRKGKLPGFDYEMELPDVVSIRSIKPISLSQFETSYKAITEEEMQMAKEALDDVTEGNSGDADADAALQKAKDQNVSDEQIKETSSVMMDAFKEVSEGYRVVEGLGDAARWNVATNELTVLQKGVQFQILIDISNDIEKNKSIALELAKKILEKCK